ncbi:MAG: hypothetical protein ACI9LM_005659, partial [Alteromonadaceae bacterium]
QAWHRQLKRDLRQYLQPQPSIFVIQLYTFTLITA